MSCMEIFSKITMMLGATCCSAFFLICLTMYLSGEIALTLSHIAPMSSSQALSARRTHNSRRVASSLCHVDPQGQSDQQTEGLPEFIHINRNDFSYRKHIKQKEDDIAICECKYNANDPDSACGERCWNVLTSIECTPRYCPCSIHCKNQRFQKREYAKTKLFRAEGRGLGLLATENIKAGEFIIEYCGEVISWTEARGRSHVYVSQGMKDAYIIPLNARECIDATKKGNLARFINHSCQPNCETVKWSVLGEDRVGIFALRNIPVGTELTYSYNFEWYGGAKVRCLCGATRCCGFLGGKSCGFQEDSFVWENNSKRHSEGDKPSSSLGPKKRLKHDHNGGSKPILGKQVDAKYVAQFLASKEAQEEVLKNEEERREASSHLDCVYREIEPAIEDHDMYGPANVPTNVAEKWIEASCRKLKAEFNLHSSILRNLVCTPRRAPEDTKPSAGDADHEMK